MSYRTQAPQIGPHTASALRGALLAILAVHAGGCHDELGECDAIAAEQVVYGRNGLVATKGQALLHDSCGNAAFCHSASAGGDSRFGAPAAMNFDMLPPTGWPAVIDRREEIWSAIVDGEMPPKGTGREVAADSDWAFDLESDDSEALPAITTHAGKAVVRNWLACGAPVVARTQAPSWARPIVDGGASELSDWSGIFERVIRPSCTTGCHGGPSAGGLVMVDECEAYAQLLAQSTCGSEPRLVPGDSASYLLEKLEANSPACGLRMPPGAPLADEDLRGIRAWVEAGAPAQNCEAP